MEHIVQIAFDFDDERVRQTIENTVKKEVIDGIQTDLGMELGIVPKKMPWLI